MVFGYERGIFGFAIRSDHPVHIHLALRRDSDLERDSAMKELVGSLRQAILLRIPDKYLDSIGVQHG